MKTLWLSLPVFLLTSVVAAAQAPTAEDVFNAYHVQAKSVCSQELNNLDQFDQARFETLVLSTLSDQSLDDIQWPMSGEFLQILAYVIVQADQVATMLSYEALVTDVKEGTDVAILDKHAELQAMTDLAFCLTPIGRRFEMSPEPAITELSVAVTKDVFCQKWHSYSNRVLELKVLEISEEEFIASRDKIGAETTLGCQEQT